MRYAQMDKTALSAAHASLKEAYDGWKNRGLKLNMSRGIPCTAQIELSQGMLSLLQSSAECKTAAGVDCRTYAGPLFDGIPEAKAFFAEVYGLPAEYIFVGGNSSLNLMYDAVARAMLYGVHGGEQPWCRLPKVKFLCPVPGYDRHFNICKSLGIEMLPVEMGPDGPDMDAVEALAGSDPAVKGIWCVPKYSNPSGVVYGDETVRRLAAMRTAAPDFRIFWDNAYGVHDLYEEIPLADIFALCREYGTEDRVFYFASTSKISFPGAGVAILAANAANMKQIKSVVAMQTIGHDKLNQLRHVRFFRDLAGVREQMKKHAAILRPKFDIVVGTFQKELGPWGVASWGNPRGGYFVSLDVPDGCAQRVYTLMKEAGVILTEAGATYPLGHDPRDRNLRIAPTFPSDAELQTAIDVLCVCVRLAAVEKLLGE